MSAKGVDRHNRWRNKTIAFRVSQEEYDQITALKALSGLQKQDYIISRLMNRDVVVVGSPRVYKALRAYMEALISEFQKVSAVSELSDETLELTEYLARIYDSMKDSGAVARPMEIWRKRNE